MPSVKFPFVNNIINRGTSTSATASHYSLPKRQQNEWMNEWCFMSLSTAKVISGQEVSGEMRWTWKKNHPDAARGSNLVTASLLVFMLLLVHGDLHQKWKCNLWNVIIINKSTYIAPYIRCSTFHRHLTRYKTLTCIVWFAFWVFTSFLSTMLAI